MKMFDRTENGTTTRVEAREALAEVNHAMMGGKRDVKTMSAGSGRYDLAYKDGRRVILVRVEGEAEAAPIPLRTLVTVGDRLGKVAHVRTVVRRTGRTVLYTIEFNDGTEGIHEAADVALYVAPAAEDAKEWSGTYSRFNHLHKIGENGRARCNSRIRPRVGCGPADQGVILYAREEIESKDCDIYTFCPKCAAK